MTSRLFWGVVGEQPLARDQSVLKLTELWRSRLDDARLKLTFAQDYKKEVEQGFPPSVTSAPQGSR